MSDELDDLFVIDKKGGNEKSSNSGIIYNFVSETQLTETNSNEVANTPSSSQRRRTAIHGKRYHQTDDYSHLRPGKLSDELREALNLGPNDIPFHIYRMRSLGYPPGWLKKARVGEGLTMFDSVADFTKNEAVTYNRDALIAYPGFNVKLDYRSVDHSVFLNCIPIQTHHMLDNFFAALSQTNYSNRVAGSSQSINDLDRLRAERERILNEIQLLGSKIATAEESEKDEDEGGNLPPDSPITSSADTTALSSVATSRVSLQTNNSNSTSQPHDQESQQLQVLAISNTEDGTHTPNHALSLLSTENSEEADGSSLRLPKRPSIEAFTVGIQPYNPFDNLPGSQGTYQRVLKTLRESAAKNTSNGATTPPSLPQEPISHRSEDEQPRSRERRAPLLPMPPRSRHEARSSPLLSPPREDHSYRSGRFQTVGDRRAPLLASPGDYRSHGASHHRNWSDRR